MTDHDDKLSRRYRELSREEPPASLDAAILAAARMAVQPRTRSRWMGPVAVAAVLVLGLGIALRMQVEQPGIESSAPAASTSAEYPVAPPAEEPPAAAERAAPAPGAKPPLRKEVTVEKRESRPQPQAFVPAPAPALPPAAAPPAAPPPASAPMREAAPMQSPAVPQPRTQPKLGIAAGPAPQRAKRAESAAAADAAAPAKDPREVELERIARLRTDGRHADADKALEAFRRANPDYRIAEAMWERVRPR